VSANRQAIIEMDIGSLRFAMPPSIVLQRTAGEQ